jgi:hypothetical protein
MYESNSGAESREGRVSNSASTQSARSRTAHPGTLPNHASCKIFTPGAGGHHNVLGKIGLGPAKQPTNLRFLGPIIRFRFQIIAERGLPSS